MVQNTQVDLSKYQADFSLKNKLYRITWKVVCTFLFRPFALPFFSKWRIFLLNSFGAKIDYSSLIYASVKVWAPYNLEVGKYSCIGQHVDCYNQGKITIGSNCVISQKSYLCASSHDISTAENKLIIRPITIDDQSWIAADAFIGPGVRVGKGAVVGARACLFRDVEPWTVVGGNPAKFLKHRILKTEISND